MKRKLISMLLSCVLIFLVIVTSQAFAAAVPEDQYQYTVSEKTLGEKKEVLTYDYFGKKETKELNVILVPKNAVISFTPKGSFYTVPVAVFTEDGMMQAGGLPWEYDGSKNLVNGVPANTTATVNFSHPLLNIEYIILEIWDKGTETTSIAFKKIDDNAASTPTQPIEVKDSPDSWAKAQVDEAITKGLVPNSLQDKYTQNITRADFCSLVVKLIEFKMGKNIDAVLIDKGLQITENPFKDTGVNDILAANKLGIVNGKGGGSFDPQGSITRQEAAVMLTNTAKSLGSDVLSTSNGFADGSVIAGWANSAVNFVSSKGVMNGVGNNHFEPAGTYTRQQAFVTILKLLKTY
jgi:hypothetical protein